LFGGPCNIQELHAGHASYDERRKKDLFSPEDYVISSEGDTTEGKYENHGNFMFLSDFIVVVDDEFR
jgi:hypothetical protein